MADSIFTNDIPRDRWDRPLIYPAPAKGKTHADVVEAHRAGSKRHAPKAYRRTTRFIGVLEERFELEQWLQRMVALGMGQRPDLVVAAASLTADRDDKKALNKVAADAKETARSAAKATTGTALHKLCERLDHGQDVGTVPAPYDQDLAAYAATRDRYGLKYAAVEQMRVHDNWQVAGTPDRIVWYNGKLYIADIKTGNVDFDNTQREICCQMAMYAHSVAYDHNTGRTEDVPPVDRQRAIIIHLPAGEGRCELHWADISAGWEGCQHAKNVWDWRSRKDNFRSVDSEPANHLEKLALNPTAAELAAQCSTLDELRALWAATAALPGGLTPDFEASATKRANELKAEVTA